mgnify:CR=1 FL=1
MDRDIMSVNKFLSKLQKSNSLIIDESNNPYIKELTFSDLANSIYDNAEELNKRGVTKGDKVIIATGNNIAYIVCFFSCLLVGAVPIPLPNTCTSTYLKEVISLTEPSLLIVTSVKASLLDNVDAISIQKHCIYSNNLYLVSLKVKDEDRSLYNKVIMMSSGTTGNPKAILLDFDKLLLNSLMHIGEIGITQNDNMLQLLPMNYSYGLVANLIGALLSECTFVISESPFSVANFFKICEKYKITLFGLTPYNLKQLLSLNKDFPLCINKITIGGDFAGSQLIGELYKYYDKEVYLTYGLTEAGPRVFTNRLDRYKSENWEELGKVIPGIEFKLHNTEIKDGLEFGELLIKSPTNMLGYYKLRDGIDRSSFQEDWLKTGDNVFYDKKTGKLSYSNRAKNLIVCGGEKLLPGYIRKIINQNPLVIDSYVYSKDDAQLGQVPIAEVILLEESMNNSDSINEISKWCRKHLRKIEVPKEIKIVNKLSKKSK